MSSPRHLTTLLLLFLLAAPAGTFASPDNAPSLDLLLAEAELSAEAFPAAAARIRAAVQDPAALPRLRGADRRAVLRSLKDLEDMIGTNPERYRNRIKTARDRVNAHLAAAVAPAEGRSDVVCNQVRKVGSSIPVTECRSRADRRADTENARKMMDQQRHSAGKIDLN